MKILYKVFKVTINYIILYLSVFSIRSRRVYVFGAWAGQKFSDNPKYLFLQALKDKSITSIWITKNSNVYNELREKSYKVYYHNSLKGIYYQLRAAAYFTNLSREDVNSKLVGNAVRINLWHGVGLKKIMNDDKITNVKFKSKYNIIKTNIKSFINFLPYRRKEYVVSTSDRMSEIFASAFQKDRKKVLQLGQPRNDIFFDDSLDTLSLPFTSIGQKVILYMPTHRREGKKKISVSDLFDLHELNKLCIKHKALFVVKKHNYHSHEVEDLSSFSNILDITRDYFDPQHLLKAADVLITDYSSCFVDYLLLDRPVIFYNYDLKEYLVNDRDLYFDYDNTTPGQKVSSFDALLTKLSDVLTNGDIEFAKQRERVKNLFYSRDNQKPVGKKIIARVKELV